MKFVNDTVLTRMSNNTDSQSREFRSILLTMKADQVEDSIFFLWQQVVSQYVDMKMTISTQ